MDQALEDRLKRQYELDIDVLSDAFISLNEAVSDREFADMLSAQQSAQAWGAIDAILGSFGIKKRPEMAFEPKTLDERLEAITKPLGVMRRTVELKPGWRKDACGSYLATLQNGRVVALIPATFGYYYVDNQSGEKVRITKKNESQVQPLALRFYKPLPQRAITPREFAEFIVRSLSRSDFVRAILYLVLVTAFSMVMPFATNQIYSQTIYQNAIAPLIAVFILIITTSLASIVFGAMSKLSLGRTQARVSLSVMSALFARMLRLPASFFRKHDAGNIANRIFEATTVSSTIVEFLLSSTLTIVVSLAYLAQMFGFEPIMVLPAVIILVVQVAFNIAVVIKSAKISYAREVAGADEQGYILDLLSGLQKIRLSAAERRAFANWAKRYKPVVDAENPPTLVKYAPTFSVAISLLGTLLIYVAGMGHATPAVYMAFMASYGLLAGAFANLSSAAGKIAQAISSIQVLKPLLDEAPEVQPESIVAKSLSGGIRIDDIDFSYGENSPLILDGFSLEIPEGAYVAIVGKSGCGKSTLMRLMTGFEKPSKGSILYGGRDMARYDLQSLRKRMGIVLQNAELFPGSIRENVSITAPDSSDDQIWEALEMAGMAEDVRSMPMELNTFITGNGGGISGGQRQRLVIARAILSKPDVLFFDEATSALDNITQKVVADSLDSLHCTRVVIAHRLSTVKNCDRIIVLGGGKIAESGTFDELMALDGEFASLMKRQQL